MQRTYTGRRYRVQWTKRQIHRTPPPGEYLVDQPLYTSYSVYVLPRTAHKSTAFTIAGRQAYHGEDEGAAFAALHHWLQA